MFNGEAPYEQFAERSSGSGGLILLLFMCCCFFIVLAVIVFLLYDKNLNEEKRKIKIKKMTLEQSKSKLRYNAINSGIDPDELDAQIEIQTEELKKRCMIQSNKYGKCSKGYTYSNGCCYADESEGISKMKQNIDIAQNITTAIGLNLLSDALIVGASRKLAGEGAEAALRAKVGSKAATSTAKLSAKAVTNAKTVAQGAKLSYAATKAATNAAYKYAVAASGGPVGLAVSAAMVAFDVIAVTIDLLDIGGYDSFQSNDLLVQMKNVIDYTTASEFEKEGMEYPILFPFALFNQAEFELANEYASVQLMGPVTEELNKNPDAVKLLEKYIVDLENDPELEPPQQWLDYYVDAFGKLHIERDRFIFEKLKELFGNDAYKLELHEEMSTPNRIGISLSERAAQEWNEQSKIIWYANNDMFKPPDEPPFGDDPPAMLYTDTYYVYDSGPSDNPVMVPKKLQKKMAICGYYGSLISFCEKVRQIQSTSEPINPYDLGVRFNFNTGVCDFTEQFCKRYGLEFKNNDCKTRPGQDWAEMIFGTTVTRETIREWEDRIDLFNSNDPGDVAMAVGMTAFDILTFGAGTMAVKSLIKDLSQAKAKKSKPAKLGPCPPGMRDDGINCWLDPVYRGVGKIPNECSGDQTKIGARCYEPCGEGYEPNEVVSTLCEPKCSGSKPMKRGLICYEDCRNKGPEWFNGSLLECAACNNGWRNNKIGGCMRSSPPGWKVAWPWRSPRGSKGIGVAKQRKSHSVKCGDDKVEHLGLCYKKCEPKGENNQYEYEGVLDWCQPKGGAGIKKGLDDRWECPENYSHIAGICYENCPEGYRDDGLICNKHG